MFGESFLRRRYRFLHQLPQKPYAEGVNSSPRATSPDVINPPSSFPAQSMKQQHAASLPCSTTGGYAPTQQHKLLTEVHTMASHFLVFFQAPLSKASDCRPCNDCVLLSKNVSGHPWWLTSTASTLENTSHLCSLLKLSSRVVTNEEPELISYFNTIGGESRFRQVV